jgi:hypothetical protein
MRVNVWNWMNAPQMPVERRVPDSMPTIRGPKKWAGPITGSVRVD